MEDKKLIKPFQIFSDKEYKRIDFYQKRGVSLQVHISDIHFGIMDPKTEYDILHEQFIKKIIGLPLDCISIDGDLFDRLYTSNTDAVLYANLFVSELIKICKQNRADGIHTVLVIIMGTKNHDADQLKLFYPYLNDQELDLRIVEKIQFEWINGCRILCIPELYDVSDDEYRRVLYESGAYDMVFMHGSIEGGVYDNKMGQAKMFRPSDFSFCMGPVVAGHIHTGPALHGFCYYNGSPIKDDKLIGLWIENQKYYLSSFKEKLQEVEDNSTLNKTKNWLARYFNGNKPSINELDLNPIGSDFRKSVWKILMDIPYGTVITYNDIAKEIAKQKGIKQMSAQAVGGAVGHNPISIIILCHRVVGTNGSLTGYAGGIKRKKYLLEHENVDMSDLFVPTKGTAL